MTTALLLRCWPDKSASLLFMCYVYIYLFVANLTTISVEEAIDRQIIWMGMDN